MYHLTFLDIILHPLASLFIVCLKHCFISLRFFVVVFYSFSSGLILFSFVLIVPFVFIMYSNLLEIFSKFGALALMDVLPLIFIHIFVYTVNFVFLLFRSLIRFVTFYVF